MRIRDMNWMMVEEYLKRDNRAVIPIGSTEQHAHLSLMVDCILSEKVSLDAAEPLRVPVFPTINFGITPYFRAFPGTISMRLQTFHAVVEDALNCLKEQGFRRVVLVNGHGGNGSVQQLAQDWMTSNRGLRVKVHNWYSAPRTWEKVKAIDPIASHASWVENFPWTRLDGVESPNRQKPMVSMEQINRSTAQEVRAILGDGNFGGFYQRSDEEMMALWHVAVQETRAIIDENW
jgi:creatinine amidohydrolase